MGPNLIFHGVLLLVGAFKNKTKNRKGGNKSEVEIRGENGNFGQESNKIQKIWEDKEDKRMKWKNKTRISPNNSNTWMGDDS